MRYLNHYISNSSIKISYFCFCSCVYVSMHIYMQVPIKAGKGHWVPWSWNYKQL